MNYPLNSLTAWGRLAALGLAITLAGCDGDVRLGGGSDTGEVSMDITDAPTDKFTEVNIVFTGIILKPADGDEIEFVFDEPRELDLLSLQGGETATLLDEEEVDAGRYSWVRLTLDEDQSHVVLQDGQQKTLFIPSGSQTGLKLVSGFTVAADSSSRFTIDFDARKSIVNPQGNPQGADYFLKPALRLVDNQEVGSIAGTVDASTVIQTQCDDSSTYTGMVYIFKEHNAALDDLGSDNEPLMAVPVSDEKVPGNFTYRAAFLTEGDYTVSYSCSPDDNDLNENLEFEDSQNVSVEANDVSIANFE